MIIISGPSTIGKNPFIYQICKQFDYHYIIPYTTRSIRPEEIHGKDYFFLSKTEFKNQILNGQIGDWDYCLDNYYGYSAFFHKDNNYITHGLSRMTLRIKSKYPREIITIFLMPHDRNKIYDTLKTIYSGRDLILRESLVDEELCHANMFDYILEVTDSSVDLLDQDCVKRLLQDNLNI